MNKLLMICSMAALVYGGSVFAGTYEYDEESVDTSESQVSSEEQQADKAKTEDQWKNFLNDQEKKEEKKEIERYGTEDQWQDFFDLQEQPEKKPFTKRQRKIEKEKKKEERAKKEKGAFNALSRDFNKMHISDIHISIC